ncbi:putative methyltransferase [Methanocella paludicola SANAE]|uniref:Methyltransferase n=1 Tax=Methanocella paludicola (strain DSM 17711 / JCM 13418 / NBRC 101707 / SANAE) TaxID=304371 RepID=D1Z1D6_METPS|nr:class I SAM-dependent methyltransferase [Methanocella paludicola]BAI62508.1 putative methyltransferase [Methanocella paludicola SANAE]
MNSAESLHRFYSGFAGKYDLFMPWDQRIRRERRFFKYVLDANNVSSVLDCFCGTGFHVDMLSDMGYDVEGIDISPDMVGKAKENLKTKGYDSRVQQGDVKALENKKKYDCVLSMGNSLPHEFGDDNILRALKGMYGALNEGGTCVIHMENFDRLYEDREPFIPSMHRRDGRGTDTFIFAIEYYEKKVVFNILSVIERGGLPEFAVDTVEYYPLKTGRLRELLAEAGFQDIRSYEDFKMSPQGKEGTYDIIMVAKKQ